MIEVENYYLAAFYHLLGKWLVEIRTEKNGPSVFVFDKMSQVSADEWAEAFANQNSLELATHLVPRLLPPQNDPPVLINLTGRVDPSGRIAQRIGSRKYPLAASDRSAKLLIKSQVGPSHPYLATHN